MPSVHLLATQTGMLTSIGAVADTTGLTFTAPSWTVTIDRPADWPPEAPDEPADALAPPPC
jgi:hypothetical protein